LAKDASVITKKGEITMAEKKLTRKESIVREKQKDRLKGVTTKPGRLENSLKNKPKGREFKKGRAFKKGGKA